MRVKAGSCGHCSAGNGLNNRKNHALGCVTHLIGPDQLLATAAAAGSGKSQPIAGATTVAAQACVQDSQPCKTAIAAKQPCLQNSHRG